MRRLALYAVAIVIGLVLAVFAWGWPEARWGLICLDVAIIAGLSWSIRRFPEMKRVHFRVGAAVALMAGFALAILLPTTPTHVECLGALAHPCPDLLDHHMHLRIAIALIGTALAWCLLKTGELRSRGALVNAS